MPAERRTPSPSSRGERSPVSAAEARAEVEARRAEVRAEREAAFTKAWGDRPPGRAVRVLSWTVTGLTAAVSAAAVADPDAFLVPFVVVTLSAFVVGALVAAADVVLAAARSRDDLMGIGGIFFLAGSAPRSVQMSLNGSLGAACAVAVGAAAARLSTPELAFGTLAPLFQLSMTGLWGVRHGLFPERGPN